jgi:hypothetical protein
MELCWLAREDIHSVVDPIWALPAGGRSAIEEWNWRMGNSRRILKGWNKNVESEYKKEKKRLSDILEDIDKKVEIHGLTANDRELYLDTTRLLNILVKEDNSGFNELRVLTLS